MGVHVFSFFQNRLKDNANTIIIKVSVPWGEAINWYVVVRSDFASSSGVFGRCDWSMYVCGLVPVMFRVAWMNLVLSFWFSMLLMAMLGSDMVMMYPWLCFVYAATGSCPLGSFGSQVS